MPSDKLKTLLEELHSELASGEALDNETKTLLSNVSSDIQTIIEKRGADENVAADEEEPTPTETLEVLFEYFEEKHPQAASIVRELVQVLNNIGI